MTAAMKNTDTVNPMVETFTPKESMNRGVVVDDMNMAMLEKKFAAINAMYDGLQMVSLRGSTFFSAESMPQVYA